MVATMTNNLLAISYYNLLVIVATFVAEQKIITTQKAAHATARGIGHGLHIIKLREAKVSD